MDRNKIVQTVEDFYVDIYASKESELESLGREDPRARSTEHFDNELLPKVNEDEVGF